MNCTLYFPSIWSRFDRLRWLWKRCPYPGYIKARPDSGWRIAT